MEFDVQTTFKNIVGIIKVAPLLPHLPAINHCKQGSQFGLNRPKTNVPRFADKVLS